jgi:hypothetical protein
LVAALFITCRFLGRFDDAADEVEEALAVAVRRDRRDLVFRVREAAPEVFQAFYKAILFDSLLECGSHIKGEEG